eukprot:TRINITY_DN13229_c1_g1_i1.p1 TRINITY_DN13229_c1_g1~~TRINITY_DN13229_c1_g1_i1.p1  ORF type:complete len:575 (+),score=119.80 TRINITY_DN13229_c1_g1_i1:99-1823(+)
MPHPANASRSPANLGATFTGLDSDAELQVRLLLQKLQQQHLDSLAYISAVLKNMNGSVDDPTESFEDRLASWDQTHIFESRVINGVVANSKFKASGMGAAGNGSYENGHHYGEESLSQPDEIYVSSEHIAEFEKSGTWKEALGENSKILAMLEEVNKDDKEDLNDENLPRWRKFARQKSKAIIGMPAFDYVMGLVILTNSVLVGVEAQLSIEYGDDEAKKKFPGAVLDVCFILIYIIELCLRLAANGLTNFRDSWFIFDFFLVCLGCLTNMVLPLLVLIFDLTLDKGPLGFILVIRSVRLLRLIRALRMLKIFRTVWRLVFGLLTSGNAMMSTFFLLLLTLYIFACAGIELITKDEHLATHPDTAYIVSYHFGSLQRTLLTLMAFVCADSVAGVYAPLIIERPLLIVYFVGLLLMVSVALMNLVTAVLVEGALNNAAADKEVAKHDMRLMVMNALPQLMDIFYENDTNHDGMLTSQELKNISNDVIPAEVFESIGSVEEVFEILDVTGDGTLTQVEFVEGLLNFFLTDVPIETVQTLKTLRHQTQELKYIKHQLHMILDLNGLEPTDPRRQNSP